MPATPEEPAPFFVSGAVRSGLTLVRSLLDAHPEITCGPDAGVVSLALGARDFENTLGELHERHFGLPPEFVRQNFATAIDAILSSRRRAAGKRSVGEKSAATISVFSTLGALFPRARFIHVVRDGRDIAASLLTRNWVDPRTGRAFDYCRSPIAAAKFWSTAAAFGLAAETALGERLLRIRYEDLVRDPVSATARLFAFLDASRCDEAISFGSRGFEISDAERESAEDLSKPIDARFVGRWRRDLSASDAQQIAKAAAPALKAFGYI